MLHIVILFAYHLLNNPFSPLTCVSHLCEVPTYVCEHTLMFHLLNFSCFDSTLHFSEALFYVLISGMVSPLSLLLFLKTGLVISKFSFIHILFIVKSEFSKLLKYYIVILVGVLLNLSMNLKESVSLQYFVIWIKSLEYFVSSICSKLQL